MATSSKVKFNLENLKKQALEAMDLRIQMAQRQVDLHRDPEVLAEEVAEWRKIQEAKIKTLAKQLKDGTIDDHRLSAFSLDPIPSTDRYARMRAQDNLDALNARRANMVAKASSLVPDDEGNVSLTKTQLQEFFNL